MQEFLIMQNKLNPHISVDCVVFGFDSRQLSVLLVKRQPLEGDPEPGKMKLPGSPVTDAEDLDRSAYRILRELTGLDRIFLKQFAVLSSPDRLQPPSDLEWLRRTSGMHVERMVTVVYYSLIKINGSPLPLSERSQWVNVDEIPQLTFDHNEIIQRAIEQLRREMLTEPIGFELLPKKFTITQLQTLQEVLLGQKIDNRNFRKRILKLEYIIPLNEREKGVSHKPAQLYRFDKKLYNQYKRNIGSVYL
ncbi:MAG: NUDIX domain-containing protein [Bacteroidales bacterium]|jgi:ADP-ribose pyrophosphatase YjhB (NUDIX family)|nr:NUDIX domain-containing protein [Bacteroidales bacterium]